MVLLSTHQQKKGREGLGGGGKGGLILHSKHILRSFLCYTVVFVVIQIGLFVRFFGIKSDASTDYVHKDVLFEISTTSRRKATKKKVPNSNGAFVPYFEIQNEVDELALADFSYKHNSETSYHFASTKLSLSKSCTTTCCVSDILISIGQDRYQLLNKMDGLDLADVLIKRKEVKSEHHHLQFHANIFDEQIIPCLKNGTIIHINNKPILLEYFFTKIRPQLTTTFILITSDSDNDTPPIKYMNQTQFWNLLDDDRLLLKWYGQNPIPNLPMHPKFVPIHIGLSMNHPQSKYLKPYLELTNYTNPFRDRMSRFSAEDTEQSIDFDRDVFVFFNKKRKHRQTLWNALCTGTSNVYDDRGLQLSCNDHVPKVEPSQIYAQASKYTFGISPPGVGWDCYRTYEYLYLGIIPIIESRLGQSQTLFDGLPILQIPHLGNKNCTRAILQQSIHEFIDDLRKQNIHHDDNDDDRGWQRLFLKYWRHQILKDAKRTILLDENGRNKEYYIGYRYTPIAN